MGEMWGLCVCGESELGFKVKFNQCFRTLGFTNSREKPVRTGLWVLVLLTCKCLLEHLVQALKGALIS